MIRLKNIRKIENYIECDFVPEDSKQFGHVVVNLGAEDLFGAIKYTLPRGYEWCKNHAIHAAKVLIKLADAEAIPTEKIVMWN